NLLIENSDINSYIYYNNEYNKMDIQTLRNFLHLSKTLSFTKASEKAFIGQSTLSKQIKQLEQEMGATLFLRDKRNVKLSLAGKYFKTELGKVLSEMDYIMERTWQLHQGLAGEIRIGYTHSAMQSLIPAMVSAINQRFPNLKTSLIEMNNIQQIQALKSRKIDISISPNPTIPDQVLGKVLIKDNFALVLPMDHFLGPENFRSMAQLAGEPFILPPKPEGVLYVGIVESICTDAGFFPQVVHQTSYANSGIRLVQGGIGVTIEPIFGLKGYIEIKVIVLQVITHKAGLICLWLPAFQKQFPEILTLLQSIEPQLP